MCLRLITKGISRSGLLAIVWAGVSGLAMSQTSATDLFASVSNERAADLTLRLENISDRYCQVSTTAYGTVTITRVAQNGKELQALVTEGSTDDDLAYLLQNHLQTLAPGEAIDLPLLVYQLSDGYILRSVVWSGSGGSFHKQYSIQPEQAIDIELAYHLPIVSDSGEPACASVFLSTFTGGGSNESETDLKFGIALLLVVVLVILWFLIKKRKSKRSLSAILLAFSIGLGLLSETPPVYASVTIQPGLESSFNECLAILEMNRDLTGPVLDAINDPRNNVEVVRSPFVTGSDMTGIENDQGGFDFTIYWNPNDRHAYHGTGGNADPCTTLYHEMYHAYDVTNGTFSREFCGASGIERKEVKATGAQNLLRERLGLPPRSHYGRRALPSGGCLKGESETCTGDRCADSSGDPHLCTFDGLHYDFQAVGEFVAARNADRSYEVQVRQQPWQDSRKVSINTAVAMMVNGNRVEIRAGSTLTLLVNGDYKTLDNLELDDGGKISVRSQGLVVVSWLDDETLAYIRKVGSFGLGINLQVSEQRSGTLEGLFGNADGSKDNDLHPSDSNQGVVPVFEQLYPDFADSWRVTDQTSLFTYEGTETTVSYTDRTFPDEFKNPRDLPNYQAAENYCKSFGITDLVALANCALDMAITGRPEFALSARTSEVFLHGTSLGGVGEKLEIKQIGESVRMTFEGKVGERVFVDVPTTNLPNECYPIRLVGPDRNVVSEGCIIDGSGHIDAVSLPLSGTYVVELAPKENVGSAEVQVLHISDKSGVVTPDGNSVNAVIDKPGVIVRYTFTAEEGSHVYLNILNATLPDECGQIQMMGPGERLLGTGCIVDGHGNINTVTLPVSGEYTILIDPKGSHTGSAELELILATQEIQKVDLDGPTINLDLKKPGSSAKLQFNGTAGQRVFIDIPDSELPDECGVLVLYGPNGGALRSGCIVANKGGLSDDGFELPVTGLYTLVLDPRNDVVGSTSISFGTQP